MLPRQVVLCSQSVTGVNYEYTWALDRIVTSLGTLEQSKEVLHACGMSSAVYAALIMFAPEAHVLVSYQLHDCTVTFRNTRAICKPQIPAQAANQLLRLEVFIFSRRFYSTE